MYIIKYLRIRTDDYSYTTILSRASNFTQHFSADGQTIYFIALFRQYSVALNMAVCPLTVTLLRLNVPD